ncbi:hypothetical protein V7114_20815 [Neobacillus niacini]|uniref:hypothetical protein n=1 Tax=Neobacillus niacini TaxID=86668 RepID=UPI003000F200
MAVNTGYEEHSLSELLSAFESQQEMIDSNANMIFNMINRGLSGDDPGVKKVGEMVKEDREIQKLIGFEFIRRFI